MSRYNSIAIAMGVLCACTLNGWNARFSPEEATVSWPVPVSEQERAGTIFRNPAIGTVLHAEVLVDGSRTPMVALFDHDGEGIPLWSWRTPQAANQFSNEMGLTAPDQLFAVYTEQTGTSDVVGNFNPENAFSPRYQLSMPAMPPADPILNPFGGSRFFQPLTNGDLAIIEVSGSDLKLIVLDDSGSARFKKIYKMPPGEGGIVIPGFPTIGGLSYSFATMSTLTNGDYYLTTSGADLMNQVSKAWILRLSPDGSIVWSKGFEMPGFAAITIPLSDERVLIAGGLAGVTVDSKIAMISSTGELDFARTLSGAVLLGVSPLHYQADGTLLLSGSVITSFSQTGITMDGAVVMLSSTGEKLAESAFDIGPLDFLFHVGSWGDSLYFDISGTNMGEDITDAILAKTDSLFSTWTTKSYIEKVGPSAMGSSFLLDSGTPSITYRDEMQDFLYYQQLTEDLEPDGDCDLFDDTTVTFYDPEISVTELTLNEETDTIQVVEFTDAPVLSPYPFDLIATPLTVEEVCGDNSGGSDPVSLWTDIAPANVEGDKLAGIGWINDTEYPYIWHYSTGGYMYILNEFSTLDNILGWDYVNGFWFWAHDGWGGWYVNLLNPDWGIAGWDKWE